MRFGYENLLQNEIEIGPDVSDHSFLHARPEERSNRVRTNCRLIFGWRGGALLEGLKPRAARL